MSPAGTTVADVIARLGNIDAELPATDGAAVFNRMYLTVTQKVAAGLNDSQFFHNPQFMEQLDITFASFWIEAYDAPDNAAPTAWVPLFEQRHDPCVLPIQFALAGMNAHIAHDLPVAVITTCRNRDTSPQTAGIREDYDAINRILAAGESEIRRSFLTGAAKATDNRIGPIAHLVNSWNIDKARDAAWVNAEAMWAMRRFEPLASRYQATLARAVGMVSRCLLTPLEPSRPP